MAASLPSINRNIDIVCFSLSRWDAPISSPAVSLVKEFSKHNRVFFIEHPYSYKDFFRERKSSKTYTEGNVTIITPPLVYPINFLPEGKLYETFSSINNTILVKTLRNVLKQNDITKFIFINFFDPFFLRKLPADIKPERFIYQCMDDLSEVAYTSRHGIRLEEELINNADFVLCTSTELTRKKSAAASNIYFHPNAADTELFKKAATEKLPKPADLDHGNKKTIGFIGSIEYRTDFELLREIALHHDDKVLFLLGPVSGNEHKEAGLHHLPNVVLAGAKDIRELPAYVQHFDCCIIPYKINKLTASIYPLKINEYLAAGKPVVATHFSDDIYAFRHHAYIAETHDEFIEAIDRVIEEDTPQKKQQRIDAASANSWEKRVHQFWEIVT